MLRSCHSWDCKRHIPVPRSGQAPATKPRPAARSGKASAELPLWPILHGTPGCPRAAEAPLSLEAPGTSEAFQTRPSSLVIDESLTSCFQGCSQGFGKSVETPLWPAGSAGKLPASALLREGVPSQQSAPSCSGNPVPTGLSTERRGWGWGRGPGPWVSTQCPECPALGLQMGSFPPGLQSEGEGRAAERCRLSDGSAGLANSVKGQLAEVSGHSALPLAREAATGHRRMTGVVCAHANRRWIWPWLAHPGVTEGPTWSRRGGFGREESFPGQRRLTKTGRWLGAEGITLTVTPPASSRVLPLCPTCQARGSGFHT